MNEKEVEGIDLEVNQIYVVRNCLEYIHTQYESHVTKVSFLGYLCDRCFGSKRGIDAILDKWS